MKRYEFRWTSEMETKLVSALKKDISEEKLIASLPFKDTKDENLIADILYSHADDNSKKLNLQVYLTTSDGDRKSWVGESSQIIPCSMIIEDLRKQIELMLISICMEYNHITTYGFFDSPSGPTSASHIEAISLKNDSLATIVAYKEGVPLIHGIRVRSEAELDNLEGWGYIDVPTNREILTKEHGVFFVDDPDSDDYFPMLAEDAERNFAIPVTWSLCGTVKVKATSLEEAIEWAKEHFDEIPLPDNDNGNIEYVDGSFELTADCAEEVVLYQKVRPAVKIGNYNALDLSRANYKEITDSSEFGLPAVYYNKELDSYILIDECKKSHFVEPVAEHHNNYPEDGDAKEFWDKVLASWDEHKVPYDFTCYTENGGMIVAWAKERR